MEGIAYRMMHMRRYIAVMIIFVALAAGCIGRGVLGGPVCAYAQMESFSVASPPNPVGSGARAMGVGGAFVAVADDATAASWNPGGLPQLQKPEVSVVYALERRRETRSSLSLPDLEGEETTTLSNLNYLSMVYPFGLARRNMVFSLNYQRLYDFDREFTMCLSDGSIEAFQADGTLYTVSPALAMQATEDLFVGLTINIWSDSWTGMSDWENNYSLIIDPNHIYTAKESYRNFRGVNANLGFLYRVNPRWTIGMVYKTPFRARLDYGYYNKSTPEETENPAYGMIESMDFPPALALGVSCRISDAWTFSADVTRRDWDELVWRNTRGQSYGLFTRFDPNNNLNPVDFPHIDPTYSLRMGVEYLKILEKTVIPFRGGIFYDPVPSVGSPHSEYGMSLGSGISLGDLIVDFAYQYRVRLDVPGTETGLAEKSWGHLVYEDKTQHMFLLSAIYHF